jgi:hypothetical protein
MLRTLELAALPSTLQLCLLSADRCNGLVQTEPFGMYVPRNFHPLEIDAAYTPMDVAALKGLSLFACSGAFDDKVVVTSAGVELLNTGYVQVEVAP